MDDMFRPLRRYADFSGRASRREYWLFALLQFLLIFAVIALGMTIFGGIFDSFAHGGSGGHIMVGLFVVLIFGLLIPNIAVQVRRFHDQDMSGWFVLLHLIPYVGGLITFVFMLRSGTYGENRFGPDPYEADEAVAEIFA